MREINTNTYPVSLALALNDKAQDVEILDLKPDSQEQALQMRQNEAIAAARTLLGEYSSALLSDKFKSPMLSALSQDGQLNPSDAAFNEVLKLLSADNRTLNLTDEAHSKWLKTELGEVELFLDIYGDNTELSALESLVVLFNFDDNKDGLINKNDEVFVKLKARGTDIDGNSHILNLSDITNGIDLREFIKKESTNYNQNAIDSYNENALKNAATGEQPHLIDHRLAYYTSDANTLFAAEQRYQKIDANEIKKFFEQNADKDGWINLRDNKIFNQNAKFKNFAYLKTGFDSKANLSEFRPIISAKNEQNPTAYEQAQRANFLKIYDEYQSELAAHQANVAALINELQATQASGADELIAKLTASKSAKMLALEQEFESASGLKFSAENLELVRAAFETNAARAASAMNDTDSVVAMKLNEDGTITLLTDSGRQIEVAELFGDENESAKRENLAQNSGFSVVAQGEELDNIAILSDGRYKTLREFGAISVSAVDDEHGKSYMIALRNGETANVRQLYNLNFIEILDELKKGERTAFDLDKPKVKFYRNVDVSV